ncbi:MAG: hypothetical protein ACSHX0_04905 [Akkermansiaceae bacterium]
MMDVADAKRLKALEKENGELKKMYADAMLGVKIPQEALEKTVSAAHRRNYALFAAVQGLVLLLCAPLNITLPTKVPLR